MGVDEILLADIMAKYCVIFPQSPLEELAAFRARHVFLLYVSILTSNALEQMRTPCWQRRWSGELGIWYWWMQAVAQHLLAVMAVTKNGCITVWFQSLKSIVWMFVVNWQHNIEHFDKQSIQYTVKTKSQVSVIVDIFWVIITYRNNFRL